jgi:transcriptional regulator with XRE-family HTH domain
MREVPGVNESLYRALIRAGMSVEDAASRLDVDPKTVRRWLEGRVPYQRHRWALAAMLGVGDLDLWPELRGHGGRPGDVVVVHLRHGEVGADVWLELFGSARQEIGILEDDEMPVSRMPGIVGVLNDRVAAGIQVRICRPASAAAAPQPSPVPGAIGRDAPLRLHSPIEVRLRRDGMYGDLCFADERMLVSQKAFGVPAVRCPLLILERQDDSGLFAMYRAAFERVWAASLFVS